MWCVWHSPETGMFEFICSPEVAHDLVKGGMEKINGKPVHVHVVDIWPEIKGIQVRATTSVGGGINVG